jgi:glutamate-1-semialdehyde 2,1-aminomutase
MWTVFFTDQPVRSWDDAARCDAQRFAKFHQGMLARGVYLPPSQFEAAFHSIAHEPAAIEQTLRAARETFASLA